MGWKSRLGSIEWQAFGLTLLAAAPVMLPALNAYFTFDDLMNLDYYTERLWASVYSNLLLFTSFRRPLGALFYLPSYHLFGMNPLPFYLTGVLLVSLNLALFYALTLRLTRSLAMTVGATALVALHPNMHAVLFNFGSVYEQAAMTGILGGLHCYLRLVSLPYRDGRRWRWYAGTLIFYWMALNAKETAVVLPAILLAYEVFYRFSWRSERPRLAGPLLRLGPMFGVAALYTLAKLLGDEAFWRGNPLYEFHFDITILHNLASYATLYSFRSLSFDGAGTIAFLFGLLTAGALLRNRHLLFGLSMGLLALLPVLPLPRVWELFLYLPSTGLALCLSALLVDALSRLAKWTAPRGWKSWRPGHILQLVVALIFLGTALEKTARNFRIARDSEKAIRMLPWSSFARQLYERFPDLPDKTVLGFENPPFNPDNHEFWCPLFLVQLSYPDREIRVFRLPQQEKEFLRASSRAPQTYYFDWVEGRLREKDFVPD